MTDHPIDPARFATRLRDAETTTEIESLLDDADDSLIWKPLGELANNYATVHSTAGNPYASVAEHISNAMDDIVLKNFEQLDGETPSSTPPLHTAVDEVVDPDEEYIGLTADGTRPTDDEYVLNLLLEHTGRGRGTDDAFRETFLDPLQPDPLESDGRYGMGFTTTLPFCGGEDHAYQFVASASHTSPGEWRFTLIRLNRDAPRYEYLTFDGQIPAFEGEFNGRMSGTAVKLYDYQTEGTPASQILDTGRFRGMLERYIPDTPLEVTITDTRYDSKIQTATTSGLRPEARRHEGLLAGEYTTHHEFGEGLGELEIRTLLFERDDALDNDEETVHSRRKRQFVRNTAQREHAVLFVADGQTLGTLGRAFLENRCRFTRTADDMVVLVDVSDLEMVERVRLFPPSRSGLKGTAAAAELQAGLKDALLEVDAVVEEENTRRREYGDETELGASQGEYLTAGEEITTESEDDGE